MVRFFGLLLLLTPNAWGESTLSQRFVVEFSKNKIYQGEIVTCHFVLYSLEDRMEVEVAKFPGFRGFWSENTALRQGPMILLPVPGAPRLRRAIIGSYQLTPMLGETTPTITPMRLVLRSVGLGGAPEEQELLSDIPPLTVLPVPAPPPALKPFFHGAVGQFLLRTETPGVRYFPKEPAALRYLLSGAGNFAEVNAIQLTLPPGVQEVSQRSTLLGSGGFQTKAFEQLVTIDGSDETIIPPLKIVAFNPTTASFETLESEPVKMVAIPRPAEMDQKEDVDFGPVEPRWTSVPTATRSALFWFLQIALAALWIGIFSRRTWAKIQARRAADPWRQLRARWKSLLDEGPADAAVWLETAEKLVFDTLAERARLSFLTRRQAASFARRAYGAEVAENVEKMIRTLETTRFSPHPPPPPVVAEMTPWIHKVRSALWGKPPRGSK